MAHCTQDRGVTITLGEYDKQQQFIECDHELITSIFDQLHPRHIGTNFYFQKRTSMKNGEFVSTFRFADSLFRPIEQFANDQLDMMFALLFGSRISNIKPGVHNILNRINWPGHNCAAAIHFRLTSTSLPPFHRPLSRSARCRGLQIGLQFAYSGGPIIHPNLLMLRIS